MRQTKLLTLMAVVMAFAFTATIVSAATLTEVVSDVIYSENMPNANYPELSRMVDFPISLYPNKTSYYGHGEFGAVSGDFDGSPGSVFDYVTVWNGNGTTQELEVRAQGDLGRVSVPTALEGYAGSENWAVVWTTNDPDTEPANFDRHRVAKAKTVTGTVNISDLKSGIVYFCYGGYRSDIDVDVTMSGSGLPDVVLENAGATFCNNNEMMLCGVEFTNEEGYSTITYQTYSSQSSAGRSRYLFTVLDALSVYEPLIIYPENDEVVPPGEVTLLWENINDPCSANPVYVDVWWGTDPNRYTGSYTQLVNSGENVTSASFTPPGPGVYYWYIDSTITLAGGDPCTLEGNVYMFTNDGPIASVNAGPDMVTWDGEPVALIADVNDDGGSPLTYSWTTGPLSGGVTAVFNPSADVSDTAITITRSPYTSAVIANSGFEADIFADGESAWMSPQGWTGSAIGLLNPGAPGSGGWEAFNGVAPEGENVLFVNAGGTASQILSEKFQEGATYTLSVDVGLNVAYGTGATYQVQLLAGTDVIAEDDNGLNITLGTFARSIVTYTYDAVADANKIGEPLQIRFNCTSGGSTDVEFDDVVLTTDTPFPVQTPSTVDVTLTVNDVTNPAVSDTMTIEVYDDACQAAREGLGIILDPDYNDNCQVYPEDLATMALAWLNDTSATEAAVHPIQPDGKIAFNGNFGIYKPGTGYTVGGTVPPDVWVNTIGDNRPLNNSTPAQFDDGTSGMVVDIPGWETPVAFGGVAATNACDAWSLGYDDTDGTTCLNAFGSWSGQNGTLAQSRDPLNLPVRGAGVLYTLSAMSLGDPEPKTLSLVVNGVELTPVSIVNPTDTTVWQEISRTYSNVPEGDARILVGTKRPDAAVGNPSLSGSRWRVDNISLDYEITDTSLATVDVGPDMVTWIGEPVAITATVVNNDPNDPPAALVYNWTSETRVGYDVNFSDPAIEDPTVTITRVPVWRESPVLNPSFEFRETFDPFPESTDKYIQWAREDWRYLEVDNNGGPVRIWNPGVAGVNETTQGAWDVGFGGNMPDGKYGIVVYTRYNDNEMTDIRPVRDYEAAVQIIDEAFNPDATYELTVKVGRLPEGPDQGGSINYLWDTSDPNFPAGKPVPGWNGYAVQLAVGGENKPGATYAGHVIGGTVVAEDYNTLTVDPNGFVTVTVTYTPGSASADLAGLPVQVRLCALENPADHSTTSYAVFDDVKLMTDAPLPLDPFDLLLSVNNVGSSTLVQDTMTIDIYETACEVTKAVFPETMDDSDHVIDCITNLKDFAVFAEDWLVDYALTGAEIKP